jgi:hypothetical protein
MRSGGHVTEDVQNPISATSPVMAAAVTADLKNSVRFIG